MIADSEYCSVLDDYSQEALVEGMMALLGDTGRDAAVWVGHDWGAGVTVRNSGSHFLVLTTSRALDFILRARGCLETSETFINHASIKWR